MMRTLASRILRSDKVLVIAHRGDSKVAPENTLPAFASAVKLGADMVELDYYDSADGVPIVFHDKDLDKKTDSVRRWGSERIAVTSKTLAELETLDAGSWFSPQFAGTRIPTLSQALDTIQAGSLTLIERKGGDAATCVELLKRKGLTESVIVQAFDWDYLADCHRLSPQLVLVALGEKELTPARLDQMQATGAVGVGWNNEHLTREGIDAIHGRGLKALVWTVDDPKRAAQLIDWGIDGIISNVPATIQQVVVEHPRSQ